MNWKLALVFFFQVSLPFCVYMYLRARSKERWDRFNKTGSFDASKED